MNRAFLAVMLVLTIAALALRCVSLGNRPFHGDEAVHAEKFRELWETGKYRYDSNEYHGPTIYYAALPSVVLNGRHAWQDTREADYRLPIAVFGALMLLALLPLAGGLGRLPTAAAGLFIAISPAFVFYSRYFIQEVPFVLFTLCFLACGWRYVRSGRKTWLVGSGVCAGLMIATKETAILSFFAAGAAAALAVLTTRWLDGGRFEARANALKAVLFIKAVGAAGLITLLTASVFITGFGTNLRGPTDYLRAYAPWFHRAQGASIQNHPFSYYLEILVWTHKPHGGVYSELLIVCLAAVGFVAAFRPARYWRPLEGSVLLWRFIALYTVILTLGYSVIPYKTPWCLLSFLLGMCMLSGLGFTWLVAGTREEGRVNGESQRAGPWGKREEGGPVPLPKSSRVPSDQRGSSAESGERLGEGGALLAIRAAFLLLILIAAGQLAWQAHRDSYKTYADPHNPYVYAATAGDIVNLQKTMDDLAQYWPEHRNMVIKVFAKDNYYWPIPWYLRRFPNVGYYSHPARSKEEAAACVTLCSSELDEVMDPLLSDTDLMNGMNEVRNGVFYERFIRMDVWTAYLTGKNRGVIRRFAPPPPAE